MPKRAQVKRWSVPKGKSPQYAAGYRTAMRRAARVLWNGGDHGLDDIQDLLLLGPRARRR
jgi:hypothetical protein